MMVNDPEKAVERALKEWASRVASFGLLGKLMRLNARIKLNELPHLIYQQ